jgi:hypothetical protein
LKPSWFKGELGCSSWAGLSIEDERGIQAALVARQPIVVDIDRKASRRQESCVIRS